MVFENPNACRSHLVDFDVDHLLLDVNGSIEEALSAIENGKERLCLLIDQNRQLVKVISDGDIRRALLSGFVLSDKVYLVHERKPITAKSDNLDHVSKMLSSKITVIPVLGAHSEVIGIIRPQDIGYASNIRQKSVAVIGLGYVGLTLALVLAENGFLVFGYDSDPEITEKLINHQSTFYEKGMQNLIDKHVDNNLIINSDKNAFEADVYVITVGTPVFRKTLKPNIEHIKSALEVVAGKLKVNDMVILRSTVPVGFTREIVIPEIERISGLRVGEDFFIAFCPERTSEGQALEELQNLPQIVGGFDENSRQLATRFFSENTHTIVDVGSLEGAEFCKLMDNTYRDTIFAYANQMAALAGVLGLNASELINKVNLGYKRNAIPLPSPGVGGPCLSKDPYILIDTFTQNGLK
ncbi:nucleotide sugar dehydrogenase, partial [Alphaproteobacteria bacterium]|nr:nucleotide sugar dehydrogenase [Alphaproteobacteria bacterium]